MPAPSCGAQAGSQASHLRLRVGFRCPDRLWEHGTFTCVCRWEVPVSSSQGEKLGKNRVTSGSSLSSTLSIDHLRAQLEVSFKGLGGCLKLVPKCCLWASTGWEGGRCALTHRRGLVWVAHHSRGLRAVGVGQPPSSKRKWPMSKCAPRFSTSS